MQLRETVTILFTDVVWSTALGDRRDPEIVRRVVTTYFDDDAIPFRKEAVRRFEQKGASVWVDRALAHRER